MSKLWEYDFEHDGLPCRVLFEALDDGQLLALKWFNRMDSSVVEVGDDIENYIYNLAMVAYDEEQELYKEMRIAQQEEHDEFMREDAADFWDDYSPELK